MITQGIEADATADATQASEVQQAPADPGAGGTDAAGTDAAGTEAAGTEAMPSEQVLPGELPEDPTTEVGGMLDGNLLNVNVDLDGDVGVAAPINGAVAANANVAAPIDAAVAANIGSVDSDAVAVAQQDAIINQNIEGSAEANADQDSDISQP
jgi:hypothetical protein